MVKQSCFICKKEFLTYPCRIKLGKGIYCSQQCAGKGKLRKTILTKICPKCGKEFYRPSKYSDKQWSERNCCSQSCGKLGMIVTKATRLKLSIFNKGKKLSEDTKRKIGDAQKGNKNYWWKGDKVGYFSLHHWIEGNYGKPKICSHCGTTTAKRFEWANISGKYKRDIKDFVRLCTKCHRKFDNNRQAEQEANNG